MIEEKINKLREELNRLINEKAEFEEIQKVSQKLDECVLNYYKETMERER